MKRSSSNHFFSCKLRQLDMMETEVAQGLNKRIYFLKNPRSKKMVYLPSEFHYPCKQQVEKLECNKRQRRLQAEKQPKSGISTRRASKPYFFLLEYWKIYSPFLLFPKFLIIRSINMQANWAWLISKLKYFSLKLLNIFLFHKKYFSEKISS